MARSKRSKLVTLSKVKKKGKEWKAGLISSIRAYVDEYPCLYVLHYQNMRTSKLKELQEKLKPDSRFCFASTKITKVALGRTANEEYQEGLAEVSAILKGTVGLFFTRLEKKEVLRQFEDWEAMDYARAGSKATSDFQLSAGPLEGPDGPLSHTLEPKLRQHKLPVKLSKGVIELLADHTVCKRGQSLTPDQAALLRVFDVKMAEFSLQPIALWTKEDGAFEQLVDLEELEGGSEDEKDDDLDFGGVHVPELPPGVV